MKKALLILLLALSLNVSRADNLPDVTPVDNTYGWAWGSGGNPKKDDPVVPEPDTYGIFMAIGITTFLLTRRKYR